MLRKEINNKFFLFQKYLFVLDLDTRKSKKIAKINLKETILKGVNKKDMASYFILWNIKYQYDLYWKVIYFCEERKG